MEKRTEGCEESRLLKAVYDPVQRRPKERPRRRPEEEMEFRRWEELPLLKSRIRGLSRVAPEWPGTSITKGLGQGGRVLPRGWVCLAWLRPPKKKSGVSLSCGGRRTCASALSIVRSPEGWGQIGGCGKGLGSPRGHQN